MQDKPCRQAGVCSVRRDGTKKTPNRQENHILTPHSAQHCFLMISLCAFCARKDFPPLKRLKHSVSQSLKRRIVKKKNPDLTHQRKMTKQTLAVLEITKQATSMTKLRLQPEQGSHCQCHCPKEFHQQKQPLHHSFFVFLTN